MCDMHKFSRNLFLRTLFLLPLYVVGCARSQRLTPQERLADRIVEYHSLHKTMWMENGVLLKCSPYVIFESKGRILKMTANQIYISDLGGRGQKVAGEGNVLILEMPGT